MRKHQFKQLFITLWILCWGLAPPASAAQNDTANRNKTYEVLAFHSYHKGLTWTDAIASGIEAHFSSTGLNIETSHEFMDTKRLFNPDYLGQLSNLYQTKYARAKFDAIISSDDHAFNFLLQYGEQLFGKTPVIFCGVNFFEPQKIAARPEITGVVESFDILRTLNIALSLQPTARRLVVVGDQTLSGKANKKRFLEVAHLMDRPVEVVHLDDHTMAEVQDYASGLSSDDILVWLHFTADRHGAFFSFHQSAEMISSRSKAPLYSFWDFHLGHGIVGGMLTSGFHQGQTAARLAERIIRGELASQIPVIEKSPNRYMFDYHQLKRFNISQRKLPADSIIVNQPATFYTQNKKIVWGVLASLATLSAIILLLLRDIRLRRQSEKALKQAGERLQKMFNNTAVALFEENYAPIKQAVDEILAAGETNIPAYFESHPEKLHHMVSRLRITDANPAALQLYGASSKSELIGATDKIFTQDSVVALMKILKAVAEGRSYLACEAVNRRLDGRKLNVLLSMNFPADLKDWDKIIICVVDLTERKRSVAALRISEDRFRTFFSHAASGMAVVDIKGNYARVNNALSNLVGYTKEELVNLNWRDITHKDDIDLTQQGVALLSRSQTAPPREKRYIHKDGRIIWALLSISRIPQEKNKPEYYIAQMQDITQIKAAQAKLKAREAHYRHIFEADLSGFYIAKPDGKIILCNNVFADILGVDSPESAVGMDLTTFYKEPADRINLIQSLSADKGIQQMEIEMMRMDGKAIYIRLNAIGRFGAEGELTDIMGYLIDITNEKRLEAQLLYAQKMESIGTMAGGIAHDFNNLLMGIMGNTSLLIKSVETSAPDYQRLLSIEQYAKSGSDLTRQLLGFAKGGKYEVKPVNLNRLIRKNLKMFGRTHKEIRVEANLAEDLWAVEADPSQIDQVLYNLYVNARHAMKKGGKLTVATSNQSLIENEAAPQGVPAGRYVEITVSDSGEGMDEDTLQRIFDPFFTTKERDRGTGLGLASAYGIINNHAGFIKVHSTVNHGSTFSIYLPASDNAAEEQTTSKSAELVGGTETILLVDDEEIVIDSVGGMIKHLGYTLSVARSGQEAIDIYTARKGEIDMVILDIVMPDMNGGETFDKLKALDPDVKVLLSTGYSAEGEANDILKRGCQGLIPKPFTMLELSQKISDILVATIRN